MAAAAVVRVDKTGTEIKSECLRCCGPSMKKLPFDLLLAHEPGKITVVPVEWNQDMSQKKLPVYSFPIELDGSRVVSMLTSLRHCGGLQCLVLSKKGTLHLVFSCKPKSFPPCVPEHTAPRSYSTIATQTLGPIIGNGHSLHDTAVGIFAAGFKQHTLHVCWVSMSEEKPAQYFHMFAVDTASSRLPFTITAIYNQKNRTKSYEILVSYYQKTGIKEERFTYYVPGIIPGFKHSGIITDCIVSKGYNTSTQYYYSGDTDGRFSIWGLDDTTINGQTFVNDFKLNGAVTSIHCNNPDIAVSTSQGEVHFFLKMRDLKIQLIPQSTYKAGKKVTFVTSMAAYSFMIFLDDGTVKEYSVDTQKEKTMGNFSVSTKMAICQKHKQHQYIAALGVDGILRRTVLKCKGGNVQMKWKISFIKEHPTTNAYLLAVGDYQGRIYILQTTKEGDNHYFYSDRVHKHEIIHMAYAFCDNGEKFMFSLDSSGVVVMRKYLEDYTPENRPIVWVCPVPSPRKLIVLDKRRIMVLGKGVATRSF